MRFTVRPTSRYVSTNILPEGFYDIVLLMMLIYAVCDNFEICRE